MSDIIWQRRPDCVSAEVEESIVLLDLDTLQYHRFNETAARTWELLAQPRSASELVDALCRQYEVSSAECQTSIDLLLGGLQKFGLIQPVPAEKVS